MYNDNMEYRQYEKLPFFDVFHEFDSSFTINTVPMYLEDKKIIIDRNFVINGKHFKAKKINWYYEIPIIMKRGSWFDFIPEDIVYGPIKINIPKNVSIEEFEIICNDIKKFKEKLNIKNI